MRRLTGMRAFALLLLFASTVAFAQSAAPEKSDSAKTLEQQFFAALRAGDADKVLSYIPKNGVNIGSNEEHTSRADIEEQFQKRRGLYCRLFDSACISATIDLANSARPCSDRELLTKSEKVRLASSEMTRNGVQQAVLVAEVKNDKCSNSGLIDFIFNLDADGWKLFSIP
ncbi:MAG TPA: hypothetical protein VK976_16225 [Verrucomicrobiae bacterium]|jgi:hypothetical protein|nr:hypothetical protein [Verrucomicrobiae bacterium]